MKGRKKGREEREEWGERQRKARGGREGGRVGRVKEGKRNVKMVLNSCIIQHELTHPTHPVIIFPPLP